MWSRSADDSVSGVVARGLGHYCMIRFAPMENADAGLQVSAAW